MYLLYVSLSLIQHVEREKDETIFWNCFFFVGLFVFSWSIDLNLFRFFFVFFFSIPKGTRSSRGRNALSGSSEMARLVRRWSPSCIGKFHLALSLSCYFNPSHILTQCQNHFQTKTHIYSIFVWFLFVFRVGFSIFLIWFFFFFVAWRWTTATEHSQMRNTHISKQVDFSFDFSIAPCCFCCCHCFPPRRVR